MIFVVLISLIGSSQETDVITLPKTNKGKIALGFGLNRSSYDLSDLVMIGDNYNFTLHDFDGNDGLSNFSFNNHNFKAELYITNHISIGFGYDKYTFKTFNNRLVQISGQIDTGDFNGQYIESENVIRTTPDLIDYQYKKLLGLNLNIQIHDDFYLNNDEFIVWSYFFGLGGGLISSETEISLFGQEAFQANNAMNGLSIQSNIGSRLAIGPAYIELGGKVGFMNIKNIKIDDTGLAKHNFIFASIIASLGITFQI